MNRRELIVALGAVPLVWTAGAAEAPRIVFVGVLAPGALPPIASFRRRLSELGWVEGRNIRFEDRWAGGDDTRYDALAAALVTLSVDAIVTWSMPAALAAKRATTTIPIVMGAIADPVGVGVVSELARPRGNVTGFSSQNFELEEKRFEMLRDLVPGMARVVMLGNATNLYSARAVEHVKSLAAAAGVNFQGINMDEAGGLDSTLERLGRAHPDGVLVPGVPALLFYCEPITAFMAANRIPAIYPWPECAQDGGLAVYSTNFDDLDRKSVV